MNRRNFLGALIGFAAGAVVGSILLPLTGPPPKTLTLKCAAPDAGPFDERPSIPTPAPRPADPIAWRQ